MTTSSEVAHRFTRVNGLRYHYAEAGAGPLVVLLHGFPELWYSWRHQLSALAGAGYRAVAPDLRGCGDSEVPAAVEDYSLFQHADDVVELVRQLGDGPAAVVGHDWGANLAWLLAIARAPLVRAVVGLSVPFYPVPRDPAEIRRSTGDRFNFVTYFQQPGAVEAELAQDPRRFMLAFLYGLSGDAPPGTVGTLYQGKPAGAKLLDGFPLPQHLPGWLTDADLDVYASAVAATGLRGALGFYRNMDRDYPLMKEAYRGRIEQPALFIGGAEEAALRFGTLQPMRQALPNLHGVVVLPRCGHWVQQERPAEVNEALVSFLGAVLRAS